MKEILELYAKQTGSKLIKCEKLEAEGTVMFVFDFEIKSNGTFFNTIHTPDNEMYEMNFTMLRKRDDLLVLTGHILKEST